MKIREVIHHHFLLVKLSEHQFGNPVLIVSQGFHMEDRPLRFSCDTCENESIFQQNQGY